MYRGGGFQPPRKLQMALKAVLRTAVKQSNYTLTCITLRTMPLHFGQEQPSDEKSRRRPPPNYSSRRVQWKVFMYVAMFMLVIILMQEARKPERWQWMWQLQKDGGTITGLSREEDIDTRLRVPEGSQESGTRVDSIIIGSDSGPSNVTPGEDDVTGGKIEATAGRDPAEQSRHDAWSRLLDDLSSDDKTQFLKGLKAARDQTALPEDERKTWSRVVGLLDEGWQQYLNDAFLAVDQDDGGLTDEEKTIWLDVVQRLRVDWDDRVRPSLEAIGGDRTPAEDQRQTLADVQRTLDGVFVDAVRDNTIFPRAAEHDAWFRLLEKLDRRDAEDLRRSSTGRVGFLQLYRQPNVYRGKLVTVQGQVRLGYHRPCHRNIYGITDYYHFWLLPTGATSPIKVCCLEVPDGFPDVKAIEAAGEKPTLAEDVEFTGYFFKRWAYRAVDGTRLAPIVLAKIPRWERQADSAAVSPELPGPAFWIVLVGGCCLLGIGVTAVIFWMNNRSLPQKDRPEHIHIPSHIDSSP